MAVAATQLQAYLRTWDAFRDIWEMDKDAFIRRYHRMNPTVAAFDSDIARSVGGRSTGQVSLSATSVGRVNQSVSRVSPSVIEPVRWAEPSGIGEPR